VNQPINEQLEELKKRVAKLEQQTEPIKVTRIEIDQGSELRERVATHTEILEKHSDTLDAEMKMLKQIVEMLKNADLPRMSADVVTLKNDMAGVKADIASIKATQSDHGEPLKTMTTKDDITSIKNDIGGLETIMMQILNRLPQTEGE